MRAEVHILPRENVQEMDIKCVSIKPGSPRKTVEKGFPEGSVKPVHLHERKNATFN